MIIDDVKNTPDHTSPDYFRVMREVERDTEPTDIEDVQYTLMRLRECLFFKEQAA